MAQSGFLAQDIKKVAPLVEESFTNAICYGQTGSGKTTGFILPNIQERLKLGHGILIYDFKGTLQLQVKAIIKRLNIDIPIHEIGKPWGSKIDVLDGITSKSTEALFSSIGSSHHDGYWEHSARALFENIYKIMLNHYKARDLYQLLSFEKEEMSTYQDGNRYYPYLNNLYTHISSAENLVNFFHIMQKESLELQKKVENYIRLHFFKDMDKEKDLINKIFNFIKKANTNRELLAEYHQMKTSGDTGGKNGVLAVLSSTLATASGNEFFSSKEIDILEVLNNSGVVIINVQDMSSSLLSMFNTSIYQKLILRLVSECNTPVSIFIDEAQKVLSRGSLPEVDVCRENNFEYILSTQDYSLLEKALGYNTAYELTRNITTQYSFKTTDSDVATDNLKKFEYYDLINKLTHKSEPMFIERAELFKAEHSYLKRIDAYKLVKKGHRGKYILVYNPVLYENNEILIEFKDILPQLVKTTFSKI